MEEANTNPQDQRKSFKIYYLVGLILVLSIVGGVIYRNLKKVPSTLSVSSQVDSANTSASNVKEFTIHGTNYSFNPSSITVNKGDMLKINFIDDDGTHNLIVDGYNVSTQTIGGGSQDSVQFVADKTGTFSFYCGVAGHRDLGMQGTLTVQ